MKKTYFFLMCIIPFLGGCKNEGPFERAGKKIDEKVENVREDIDQMQDEAESKLNQARKRMNQNSHLKKNALKN